MGACGPEGRRGAGPAGGVRHLQPGRVPRLSATLGCAPHRPRGVRASSSAWRRRRLAGGRSVGDSLLPVLRRVRPLRTRRATSASPHAGRAEPRPPAQRHTRLSRDRRNRRFMGCSASRSTPSRPSTRSQGRSRGPPEASALFACGLSTRLGTTMYTADVQRERLHRLRAGIVGLGAVAVPAAGPSADRLRRSLADPARAGEGPEHDQRDRQPGSVEKILEMTDGFGADYTFEATRNVGVMAQAVEAARMGWGRVPSRGGPGRDDARHHPPLADRRTPSRGSSFSRVKGRAPGPGPGRSLHGREINVEPFISHTLTLDEVDEGFELIEAPSSIRSMIRFN